MIVYCDIDGTICSQELDYKDAKPFPEMISKINDLFDNGNDVIYWTARGTGTGLDWKDITEKQLHKWGVKYTELKFGKPVYNMFIDDRAVNALRMRQ